MKKAAVKLCSVFLCFLIVIFQFSGIAVSADSAANHNKLFGVITDSHLFPEDHVDPLSADFQENTHNNMKLMGESEAILRASLKTIAARKANGTFKMDYLLMPGDITFNGEKSAHIAMAKVLHEFEASTGIQVYIINGNHDIYNTNACSYTIKPGKKITAKQRPDLLLTTPEDFRNIYADFGFAQADSVYTPPSGTAGMMSYSLSLPGGYRLIAIDSCIYSLDSATGTTNRESRMLITPDLLKWVCGESKAAVSRGETVIGMVHGNIVEHYVYQPAVASGSLVSNYEKISYDLADSGMHFIFSGHNHINDTAGIVSGNNEIIYDIETCGLTTYPNIYREATFNNCSGAADVSCALNNVDCDADSPVDLSGISDIYGIIAKPFKSNYSMPMLCGGSIDQGIMYDTAVFIKSIIDSKFPSAIREALPDGISGLLKEKGLDFKSQTAKLPAGVIDTLQAFNIPIDSFAQLIDSIIMQIDQKYIINTAHTTELVNSVIEKLSDFELAKGDSRTKLGKIVMTGITAMTSGDENPNNYPEVSIAANALSTQSGADRLIDELLNIVINDLLFDDILPSISLDELKNVLPAQVMAKLHSIAGDNLNAGAVLEKIFDSAAVKMKNNEFFKIKNGRDVFKDLIYTVGYQYLNPEARLQISCAFAEAITNMTSDNNPEGKSDSGIVLQYTGKTSVEPSVENYRLPNDIAITKGPTPGDIIIDWNTIYGIDGTDLILNPLPSTAVITSESSPAGKKTALLDLGFISLDKTRSLLSHRIIVSDLRTGVQYTYSIGDKEKGLMSETAAFSINKNGQIIEQGKNDFFSKIIEFFKKLISFFKKFNTVLNLFP